MLEEVAQLPFKNKSKLSAHQTRGPWHLPLRLRRETYCKCHDTDAHTFFHWYAGTYWECLLPSQQDPAAARVQLILVRPTEWKPSRTDPSEVPIQAYARVRHTLYTHPSFDARAIPSNPVTPDVTQCFSTHIQTLDLWMQQLMSNIRWIVPYD